MNNTIRIRAAENLQLGLLASNAVAGREMMCSIIDDILPPTITRLMLLGGYYNDDLEGAAHMVYDITADKWLLTENRIPPFGGSARWARIIRINDNVLLAAKGMNSIFISGDANDPRSTNDCKYRTVHLHSPSNFDVHEFTTSVLLKTGQVMVFNAGQAGTSDKRMHCVLDLENRAWIKKSTSRLPGINACCVCMRDGRVLVAGGYKVWNRDVMDECFIYYPVSNRFVRTACMNVARAGAAGCLLDDGRVFVCGGRYFFQGCEIFDPATCTWSVAGSMLCARLNHVCFHITDSMIFIGGGVDHDNRAARQTCEMYDITTGTSTKLAIIPEERAFMTVFPLQ